MNNSEYIKEEYDRISKDYEKHKQKKSFYDKGIVSFLKKYIKENNSVVDIGCGTGIILRRLNPKRGVGVDISEGMIEKAKEYNKNENLKFFVGSVEDIKIKDKFDFVTLIDIFPYVEDGEKALNEVKKLCNSNTKVIIFYFNPFFEFLVKFLEKTKLKAPDPVNRDFRSKEQLVNWLKKANYKIEKIDYGTYFFSIRVVAKPIDF